MNNSINLLTNGDISYKEVIGLPLDAAQSGQSVKYGLAMPLLYDLGDRKQFSAIAQLYGLILNDGLVLSTHLFQGLNRNLYCDNTSNGDHDKFVFSRRPAHDFYWEGGSQGGVRQVSAPPNQVFVVLISINNKHRKEFPEIAGWIDHWNWVDEDPVLKGAPIEWVDRYKLKVWSKEL